MKSLFFTTLLLFSVFCFYKIKTAKPLPKTENEVIASLTDLNKSLKKTPNIYLFIETELEQKSQFPTAFFPATQEGLNQALFSFFHAENPKSFTYRKGRNWTIGSCPLRLLKSRGYAIHALSTELLFEGCLEELIFGKDRHLTNSYSILLHKKEVKKQAFALLENKEKNKQLFTFLMNSKTTALKECLCYIQNEGLSDQDIVVCLSQPKKIGRHLSYKLYLKLGEYFEMEKEILNFDFIFPTILHYLFEENLSADLYSGNSCLYKTSDNVVNL